ncbi:MAG TPA: hypothetical protein DEG23_01780 [Coxiellaceae bacterium]|nr:hypothetical protein [Coxiellaceae bacterium]
MSDALFLMAFSELLEIESGTIKGNEELIFIDNWDSLAVLGFIALADKKFGKILKPDDISRAKTVRDLINLIER